MKRIYIRLDYLSGPIWNNFWEPDGENRLYTGFNLVDFDRELIELNEQAQVLYASYYTFDSDSGACSFSYEKEKAAKCKMLDLLFKIIKRLKFLSGDLYEIVDEETDRIKAL